MEFKLMGLEMITKTKEANYKRKFKTAYCDFRSVRYGSRLH